jgi:serine/threonine-protein kinase HipA
MSLFSACRARLSIAGAQDKLPCIAREGRYVLPAQGTPTTHIVKPPSPFFPGLPENEALCLDLARACGLPCAESGLDVRKDGALFVTRRWDRRRCRDGRVERVHQEDFRQVLGLRPEDKYQESGAYEGFPSLLDAARSHGVAGPGGADPALFLAKAAVFGWLVGNGDAHAGNFAVLHRPAGPEFAPLYDIVCTRVYPGLTTELAMRIGGAKDAQAVWEEDFVLLAEELALAPERVLAEAHRQKDALRERLATLPEALKGATAQAVASFVEARCADVDCWQDPRPAAASCGQRTFDQGR